MGSRRGQSFLPSEKQLAGERAAIDAAVDEWLRSRNFHRQHVFANEEEFRSFVDTMIEARTAFWRAVPDEQKAWRTDT